CEFQIPPKGRILAVWERDHLGDDLDFDFATSPAAEVLSGKLVHFPSGVLRRFPNAGFLAQRNTEGYMAVPFIDSCGDIAGFISVFDDRPRPADSRRLFIVKIFAARAAAEFERLRAEEKLQENEARYRDLSENAPIGYLTVGPDLRVLSVNRRFT